LRVQKYRHPVLKEKDKVAKELFYDRCFWCLKKYGKGFGFHHLRYPQGELRYRDFNNTINYHRYILPRVKKEPHRFVLVCQAHHHFTEIFAAKISLENENELGAYSLNNNSSLKRLLERYCNLTSMFGDIKFEPR
jgi:hypothetical protein